VGKYDNATVNNNNKIFMTVYLIIWLYISKIYCLFGASTLDFRVCHGGMLLVSGVLWPAQLNL